MILHFSYPRSFVYGLYFYLLFQAMFYLRLGHLNLSFEALDIVLWVVGVASVALAVYFSKKLERGRVLLWIPFLLALPFSYVGALGGGLLGAVGILIFGLVPFIVTLPIGFLIIRHFTAPKSL